MRAFNALGFRELCFGRGDYQVIAMPSAGDGPSLHILTITAPYSDERDAHYIPQVDLSPLLTLGKRHHRLVTSAIVRAGARHPGLDDLSLRDLHRAAHRDHHVELFCDINVLNTGLIKQLVDSLGHRCARVVVSSSSIDILHEHETYRPIDWDTALSRSEMSRNLTVLEELRGQVAVHVHSLRPGTSRYLKRSKTDAPKNEPPDDDDSVERDGLTYITEDRLMVSAFWDYIQTVIPRVPVQLVTSDHILARVCAAERAPFVFAKTPYDVWWKEQLKEGRQATPDMLWVDPYALAFRYATLHGILWELALSYNQLRVRVLPRPEDHVPSEDLVTSDFVLVFNPWKHRPGSRIEVSMGRPDELKGAKAAAPVPKAEKPVKRRLKLSLLSVFDVMPTRVEGRVPLSHFKQKGEDSLRQLAQIGHATGLFSVNDKWVEGLPGLSRLLAALQRRDYIEVNEIFRKLPAYDDVLREAAAQKPFPNNTVGGAVTGWAIMLGAAYKTLSGALFGLAELQEEQFESAVARYHDDIGKGERSVLLPPILDKVCRTLQISPVRFEAMLDATIGNRALADFEVQRATVRQPIPPHKVVVAPSTAASESYLHHMEPGTGIHIGNKLVNTLVRTRGTTV